MDEVFHMHIAHDAFGLRCMAVEHRVPQRGSSVKTTLRDVIGLSPAACTGSGTLTSELLRWCMRHELARQQ